MMETLTEPEQLHAIRTDLADLKTRRAEIGAAARKLEAEIAVLESQIDSSVVSGVDPSRLEKQLRTARETLEATERHAGALDREIQKKTREAESLSLDGERRTLEDLCRSDVGAGEAWRADYIRAARALGDLLARGVDLGRASQRRAERLAEISGTNAFSATPTDQDSHAVAFGEIREELRHLAEEDAVAAGGRVVRFDPPVFGVLRERA